MGGKVCKRGKMGKGKIRYGVKMGKVSYSKYLGDLVQHMWACENNVGNYVKRLIMDVWYSEIEAKSKRGEK
jgi:hypothetical protein